MAPPLTALRDLLLARPKGNEPALLRYWRDQMGQGQGRPGDYDACVRSLSAHPQISDPHALCAWLHTTTTGHPPGRAPAEQAKHASLHDGPTPLDPFARSSGSTTPTSNLTSTVLHTLAPNFPPSQLTWVARAYWQLTQVPVARIHLEPTLATRLDTEDQALLDYTASGRPVDPLVLLARRDGTYTIVDGHHRTRIYRILKKPSIPAYVGTLPGFADPWARSAHALPPPLPSVTTFQTFERYERRYPVLLQIAKAVDTTLRNDPTHAWTRVEYACETCYAQGPLLRVRKYDDGTAFLERKRRDAHQFVTKERTPWAASFGAPPPADIRYQRVAWETPTGDRVTIDSAVRMLKTNRYHPSYIVEVKGDLPPSLAYLAPFEDTTFSKWAWLRASGLPLSVKFAKPQIELERERRWAVHPDRLPPSEKAPRFFLQGYWHGPQDDISLRADPLRHKAVLRRKSHTPGPDGARFKIDQPVDYDDALRDLAAAPAVAVKRRTYHTASDGRHWKIERFDDGTLQAETEAAEGPEPIALPPFIKKEAPERTGDIKHYSISHARPRSPQEIAAIAAAHDPDEALRIAGAQS